LTAAQVASAFTGGTVTNAALTGGATSGWTFASSASGTNSDEVVVTSSTANSNVTDLGAATYNSAVAAASGVTQVSVQGDATNNVTETHTYTMAGLSAGQSITVGGLTVTASGTLTAAQVASAFTGGTVTDAALTGTATSGWTFASSASGTNSDEVVVTSSTANADVTDLGAATYNSAVAAASGVTQASVQGAVGLSNLSSGVYVTAPTRDVTTQAITADPGQANGSDAQVEVGGVTYSSPSNRFSSLVKGVNIDLNSTVAINETIRLHTTRDMAKYKEIVSSIVANYNDLMSTITDEIKYDKDIQRRGGLANDPIARGFMAQMRRMTTDTIAIVNGKATTFGQIGVKTNRDGKLELDNSRFDSVAELSPEIIEAVVASTSTRKGILERMNAMTDVVLGRSSDFVKIYEKATKVELPKLADQKAKLDSEMDALHARYIKQFSAMQEVLKSTSSSKESLTNNMAAWTAGLKT
jgi:flagellar hook-associated protein 2